jgi:hypothetical protein
VSYSGQRRQWRRKKLLAGAGFGCRWLIIG